MTFRSISSAWTERWPSSPAPAGAATASAAPMRSASPSRRISRRRRHPGRGRADGLRRNHRAGGSAIAVSVDITKRGLGRRNGRSSREAFGGIDILVNNAALMAELGYLPAADIPLDEWNRIMDVNLTGACSIARRRSFR